MRYWLPDGGLTTPHRRRYRRYVRVWLWTLFHVEFEMKSFSSNPIDSLHIVGRLSGFLRLAYAHSSACSPPRAGIDCPDSNWKTDSLSSEKFRSDIGYFRAGRVLPATETQPQNFEVSSIFTLYREHEPQARFSPPFAARVLRPRRAPFQQNRRGRSDCLGNSRVQHIISFGSSTGAELPRNTTRQLMHLGLLLQLARTSPDETKPSGRGLDRSQKPAG